MSQTDIHPTALVDARACLGAGVNVGPYSIVGSDAVIGEGTVLHSHVVISGRTTIGKHNEIFPFAAVGLPPQDLKFHGELSTLVIGDSNKIREYVTMQPGTEAGGMTTVVGSNNLCMANSHIGHDCHIGNDNVIANSAAIAGHVTIGSSVTVGGLVGIHQFVRIGDFAFLGAGSMVNKDIPPYCMAHGDRAGLAGINSIGLARHGFSVDEVKTIEGLYRELFLGKGTFAARLAALQEEVRRAATPSQRAAEFLTFIATSPRGITLPRKSGRSEGA